MKAKRILAGLLAVLMFVGMLPMNSIVLAEEHTTVYLSVSKYGELVEDKNNDVMALVPVNLNGKDSYNLDDVFKAAHDAYYDGEDGYASSVGEWGLGVDKFWGDTSYNFGYQVNSGSESVMGLSHEIEDGDYIDACIYKNTYPATESYSRFDIVNEEIYDRQELELTLSVAGYDENWNTVFSACEGATITIDGKETEIVTDEDGKATITFDGVGQYIVSAKKTKEINEETVPAITAPVCVVNVEPMDNPVDVYVTISKYGEIVTDKNGDKVAYAEVNLDGKAKYNLDDVFKAVHDIYYDGDDGYASSVGEWGLGIDKLWGDTSYNFGYQVNGGSESVMGLSHEIEDGDYIDACIYKNTYPATENYSKFDIVNEELYENQDIELTLSIAGYDENWNTIFSACEGATVTINGEETEIVTDENGKVVITFSEIGEYIVSAQKAKVVSEETVPAITAPVCIVNIKAKPTVEMIHNIATKYSSKKLISDGNIYWFVADLADYLKAYPDSDNVLNDELKQECLDKIISFADNATKPGELSKSIIALRALGHDARNVYTNDFREIDVVEKLTKLIDEKNSDVTNAYTLPYVIIALQQGEGYITKEQMNYLIETAISTKEAWQDTTWGPDAVTPMVIALSPYYDENQEIKEVIDESINIIKNCQANNGGMGNAASTGLAISAFSSLGIDSETIIKNGKSLIDGLLVDVTEKLDGFNPTHNSFSTEQGFRGLVSLQLLKSNQRIYDFISNPMNKAMATWVESCPVSFEITPTDANVTIEGFSEFSDKSFDLPEGRYEYSVSKSGYITKTGTVTVTADDAENHVKKIINVALTRKSSGSGSGSSKEIKVRVKVMSHDEAECNNSYTYKNNSASYNEIVNDTVVVDKKSTVFDVLDEVLTKNDIEYVEGSYGYISSIDGIGEFEHGENSGWMFKVDGKHTNLGCREQELTKNVTVEWFFTDDYTKERGSEDYNNNKNDDKKTEVEEDKVKEEIVESQKREFSETTFRDIKSDDWHYKATKYVYENNIMDGTGEGFEPDTNMTRAMLVTVLYKLEAEKINSTESKFEDVPTNEWYYEAVAWAANKGVISGISDTQFAPNDNVTREQMALIIYKYAKLKAYDVKDTVELSQFTDSNNISDWALESLKWANAHGLINGTTETIVAPQEIATRAQVATVIMKFCENIVK